MNREAQGVVLLLLGGAVLRAGSTDVYLRYVKAGLRPLLLVAGVVLIIAALATFWYELRRSRGRRAGSGPGDPGHSHREPRVAWLLVLPVFILFLVVPAPLGSYAAGRAGTALQLGLDALTAPPGDPARMSVLDYATVAAFDHGHSLGGRRVEVTGFISVGPHGTPYLTSMILTCCAADAQPIKVGMTGHVPPDLRPDAWFDIIGTYTEQHATDPVNHGPIPYIDVIQATHVPGPPDPYSS